MSNNNSCNYHHNITDIPNLPITEYNFQSKVNLRLLLATFTLINVNSMINYSGINVKNLTEDQMKVLIGLKFSDVSTPSDPDVINTNNYKI